jgi:diguanylate cyclase (GGDEF)-like protein
MLCCVSLGVTAAAGAASELDALREQLAEAEGRERIEVLSELAVALVDTDPDEALARAEEGVALAEELRAHDVRAGALKALGVVRILRGELEAAESATQDAVDLAERFSDRDVLLGALHNLGLIHRQLGRLEESAGSHVRVLELAGPDGDPEVRARAHSSLAALRYLQGAYDQSLDHALTAVRLHETTGDLAAKADAWNTAAAVYDTLSQRSDALRAYQRSLDLYEEIGSERGMVNPLNNLGILYYQLNQLDRAEAYHRRALEIRQRIGDRAGEATSLNNLANIARSRGDLAAARELYERALAIREELGDRQQLAVSLRDLGDLHRELGNLDRALELTTRSLEVARELGARNDVRLALADLSKVQAARGEAAAALETFQEFHELEKEILGEQAAARVAEIRASHEVAEREKRIEVLHRQNTLQRRLHAVLVVAVLLLIAVLLLVANRARTRLRTNRMLMDKNAEIELQKTRLEELNQILAQRSQEYYVSSIVDRLTGTYNRAYLLEALAKAFSLARRYDEQLGCVFLDLDHFKSINDAHGHRAGDRALAAVAAAIRGRTREEDTLGRYGGEEFVLLLPNTGVDGALEVAERILEAIRRERIELNGASVAVTASAGVAELRTHGATSADELLEQADAALYLAKEAGRDRAEVFVAASDSNGRPSSIA